MFNVYMLFVVDAKKVHDKKCMKIFCQNRQLTIRICAKAM